MSHYKDMDVRSRRDYINDLIEYHSFAVDTNKLIFTFLLALSGLV